MPKSKIRSKTFQEQSSFNRSEYFKNGQLYRIGIVFKCNNHSRLIQALQMAISEIPARYHFKNEKRYYSFDIKDYDQQVK